MIYIIASTTYISHLQNRVKTLNKPQKFIQPQRQESKPTELVILDDDDKKPVIKTTKNKQSKGSNNKNKHSTSSNTKLKIGDIL